MIYTRSKEQLFSVSRQVKRRREDDLYLCSCNLVHDVLAELLDGPRPSYRPGFQIVHFHEVYASESF